ncbi:hypothetical protein Q3G72_034516 [Acer saccharum]|nr:hypothetical protein Q3G72_034516 [Acer saccharum]
MALDYISALDSTCVPYTLTHHGHRVTSTGPSPSQPTDKRNDAIVAPSRPVTKRKRSPDLAPCEKTWYVENPITPIVGEEAFTTVPKKTPEVTPPQALILRPGASDFTPFFASDALLAMTSGSSFFGSPTKYQDLLEGSLNSRLKVYFSFSSTMLVDLKSIEDMRDNLEA